MAKTYERNINIRISENGSDPFRLEATLLDLDHSIRIEMRVDPRSGRIEAAEAQMMKGPYRICPRMLDRAQALVGLTIGRGILRGIRSAVGGNTGCAHLVEVCTAAVQFGANHLFGHRLAESAADGQSMEDLERLPEHEQIAVWKPLLGDTCHVFRRD